MIILATCSGRYASVNEPASTHWTGGWLSRMLMKRQARVQVGNQTLVVWQYPVDLLTTLLYSAIVPITTKWRACLLKRWGRIPRLLRHRKPRFRALRKSEKDPAIIMDSANESTANLRHSGAFSSRRNWRKVKQRCVNTLRKNGVRGTKDTIYIVMCKRIIRKQNICVAVYWNCVMFYYTVSLPKYHNRSEDWYLKTWASGFRRVRKIPKSDY